MRLCAFSLECALAPLEFVRFCVRFTCIAVVRRLLSGHAMNHALLVDKMASLVHFAHEF
jgi:hypothetical protein